MHYSDLPSDIPTDEEVLSLLGNINKEAIVTGEKQVTDTASGNSSLPSI
jgi:hypothetical protein